MSLAQYIFHAYALLGVLIVLFSSRISSCVYSLVLVYTNKANLRDVFLFKVNKENRDSLFSLARVFTIFLGLVIIGTSLYFIQKLGLAIFW